MFVSKDFTDSRERRRAATHLKLGIARLFLGSRETRGSSYTAKEYISSQSNLALNVLISVSSRERLRSLLKRQTRPTRHLVAQGKATAVWAEQGFYGKPGVDSPSRITG